MNNRWSEDQEQFLVANFLSYSDVELADQLTVLTGRPVTRDAVRLLRQKLGLKRKAARVRRPKG